MNATPGKVLPLFDSISEVAYDAIDHGIEFADGLLNYREDPWYWSHSARFAIRQFLAPRVRDVDRWSLRASVPNGGIHLSLDGAHPVRLVRSLGRDAPPPGRNRQRRDAWTNNQQQLDLQIGAESLPLMNLLMDWHLAGDEPIVHVSLPRGPWRYGTPMRVHWRHQLPRTGGVAALTFQGDDGGDPLVTIDGSEEAASA